MTRSGHDTRRSRLRERLETGLPSVVATACRRHQIASFLGLAFAWTWSVWLVGIALGYGGTRWIQVVGAWGPLLSAAVVTTATGDVRAWATQLVPERDLGLRWYALAVLVPFALTQAGSLVGWLLGVPIAFVDPTRVLGAFLLTLFVSGALEEFGWRGFLQPYLQQRRSAVTAALLVGFVWWLWHVPLLIGGVGAGYQRGEVLLLLAGLPLLSIVMAWLYNSTRGGLPFVMLFHATINATPVFETLEGTPVMGAVELVALVGVPLAIVAYYGADTLASAAPDGPFGGIDESAERD